MADKVKAQGFYIHRYKEQSGYSEDIVAGPHPVQTGYRCIAWGFWSSKGIFFSYQPIYFFKRNTFFVERIEWESCINK